MFFLFFILMISSSRINKPYSVFDVVKEKNFINDMEQLKNKKLDNINENK